MVELGPTYGPVIGVRVWGGPKMRMQSVMVRNGSDQPIYDVIVRFERTDPESQGLLRRMNVPVFGPGQESFQVYTDEKQERPLISGDGVYLASIEFTDAVNQRWRREANGWLVQVPLDV
jgi:hypothetical protein